MPQILHEVQAATPGLVIHQVEASVPEQYRQLADGRLDVGIGRAAQAPPQVASHLFRHDPLGVLVPPGHRLAALDAIPVAVLADEPLLLAEEARAPAHKPCRAASAGSSPQTRWRADRPGYVPSRGDTLALGCHHIPFGGNNAFCPCSRRRRPLYGRRFR